MMKKKYLYLLLGLSVLAAACTRELEEAESSDDPALSPEAEQLTAEAGTIPGKMIVEFDDDLLALVEEDLLCGTLKTRSSGLNDLFADLGIESVTPVFPVEDAPEYAARHREAGLHRFYELSFTRYRPVTRAVDALSLLPGIRTAEPEYAIQIDDFKDPLYLSKQWHYKNTTTPGVDVNCVPVWENYTTGDPSVIVSVVDEGVDLEHEDLADNAIPGGPDGSFNFSLGSYSVDPMSHGTHVAGTIAAVNGNGKGVCGIAGGDASKGVKGARIMSCQFFGISSDGSSANAIRWGADHGAVISQNSWGYVIDVNRDGTIDSSEMERAKSIKIGAAEKAAVDYFIRYAGCDAKGDQKADSPMKGGLVIFSAGNDNIAYGAPANYEAILSVGAVDKYGHRSSFSNYGDWVDICAPGTGIHSTLPENQYGQMSGTSMACPHVSGVAALVVSYCGGQGFTNDMLWTKLVNGANPTIIAKEAGKNIGPLVDALGAIMYGDSGEPGPVSEFTATGRSNNIDFEFQVPASSEGDATYAAMFFASENKASLSSLNPSHPGSDVFTGSLLTSTKAVGETVVGTISGLSFEKHYYVTMATYSYSRSFSALAPIREAQTLGNNPPVVINDYEGEPVYKNYQVFSIPLTISDPDGHEVAVSYKAGSGADALMVDVATGGYIIRVNGPLADAGTYTGHVTAKDAYGLSAELDVRFTLLPNHAPVAVQQIPNQILQELGYTMTILPEELFTDEDGEPIALDIDVSDNSIIHATRSENLLYLTTLSYGSSTVTITASDAKKEKAVIAFSVLVREEGQEVSVYPNPVVDVFYVATGEAEEDTEFSIYGASGALVYQQKHLSSAFNPASINIRDYAPGRYSLVFTYGGKSYNRTLIKK